ncbi:MAG TPA: M20/M25/M40 family metallo-hydrolase [bacterium]|nr:M20/M25/M40 family metallo-hydrolase [bacterium]
MLFDLIEECKKIIAINTAGSAGTRRLVEHLVPYCRALGFRVFFQSPDNGPAADLNLIAHTQAEGAPDLCPQGLAMVTHLDTVPAGDRSLWTETGGDPYRATIQGDKIYGLGSADTKLDFLCKLLAIEQVGLQNVTVPVVLVGTFGEERSLAGARLLLDGALMKPKFALIGEPCELKAVVAHKGILYMRAVFRSEGAQGLAPPQTRHFHGRAAHGSMPHLGENAVEKAIRWLMAEWNVEATEIDGGVAHNIVPDSCRLSYVASEGPGPRVRFLKSFIDAIDRARLFLATHRNPSFDPPHTTGNIGVIRTHADGTVEIEFDYRLIPETDSEALFSIFEKIGASVPGAAVEEIRSNRPLNTPPDSEIVRRVGDAQEACGLARAFVVKSGNTEGAIFHDMGAQAVITGPGRAVGNIHAPNEHNEISQLKKAVEFYTAFLRRFC